MGWWFRRPAVRVRSKGYIDPALLRRLVFENERVEGATYASDQLDAFLAIASSFKKCAFERLSIRSACFGGGRKESVYEACSFDDSRIDCGATGVARFVGCTFRGTYLYNFFGHSVSMIDCTFSGILHKVVFFGKDPESGRRNEFHGNDFREARLNDVAFREGIDLTLQRLPVGWVKPDDLYGRSRTK